MSELLDDLKPPLLVGDLVDERPDVTGRNIEDNRFVTGNRMQIRDAARTRDEPVFSTENKYDRQ